MDNWVSDNRLCPDNAERQGHDYPQDRPRHGHGKGVEQGLDYSEFSTVRKGREHRLGEDPKLGKSSYQHIQS